MNIKRSARELKENETAQKNADRAIQRYLETNIETLGWLRTTVTELVKAQATIDSQNNQIENDLKSTAEVLIINEKQRGWIIEKDTLIESQKLEIEKLQSQLDEIEQQMIIDIERDEVYRG